MHVKPVIFDAGSVGNAQDDDVAVWSGSIGFYSLMLCISSSVDRLILLAEVVQDKHYLGDTVPGLL